MVYLRQGDYHIPRITYCPSAPLSVALSDSSSKYPQQQFHIDYTAQDLKQQHCNGKPKDRLLPAAIVHNHIRVWLSQTE